MTPFAHTKPVHYICAPEGLHHLLKDLFSISDEAINEAIKMATSEENSIGLNHIFFYVIHPFMYLLLICLKCREDIKIKIWILTIIPGQVLAQSKRHNLFNNDTEPWEEDTRKDNNNKFEEDFMVEFVDTKEPTWQQSRWSCEPKEPLKEATCWHGQEIL